MLVTIILKIAWSPFLLYNHLEERVEGVITLDKPVGGPEQGGQRVVILRTDPLDVGKNLTSETTV